MYIKKLKNRLEFKLLVFCFFLFFFTKKCIFSVEFHFGEISKIWPKFAFWTLMFPRSVQGDSGGPLWVREKERRTGVPIAYLVLPNPKS